jgi:thiol-disulfide isomerase/thioredoxin
VPNAVSSTAGLPEVAGGLLSRTPENPTSCGRSETTSRAHTSLAECVCLSLLRPPPWFRTPVTRGFEHRKPYLSHRVSLAQVLESEYLYVVEFYREGCGYCQLLTPIYEKLAGSMKHMVRPL